MTNTDTPLRMEYTVHFATQAKGRKTLQHGEKPTPVGRIPRVARLLALAHHFDHLIEQGVVQDYAEIARLTQLSRARVAQIMALKFLAPDIQERIAQLPQSHGRDQITEKQLRRIAMMPEWEEQRCNRKQDIESELLTSRACWRSLGISGYNRRDTWRRRRHANQWPCLRAGYAKLGADSQHRVFVSGVADRR